MIVLRVGTSTLVLTRKHYMKRHVHTPGRIVCGGFRKVAGFGESQITMIIDYYERPPGSA
jgi:hypothetical protein